MHIKIAGKKAHYTNGGGKTSDVHACILIHGAGMDRSVWQLQTRALASMGVRVIAGDLPGHGKSEGDALSSITEMANWIVEVMDAVDIKSATLIGHSMGSMIALDMAANHPQRVDSMILLGVAEIMPVHEDLLKAALDDQALAAGLITYWGISSGSMIGGRSAPGFSVMGASQVLLEQSASGVLYKDLMACNEAGSMADTASIITCPTQFILAKRDKMTPLKSGLSLAAKIKNVDSLVLDDAGHMMMLESPNAVFKIMRTFIKNQL